MKDIIYAQNACQRIPAKFFNSEQINDVAFQLGPLMAFTFVSIVHGPNF